MGQMSCGNSALTRDSDNLGKDSRVGELSPCADCVQMLFKEHSLEVAQALKSKEANNS